MIRGKIVRVNGPIVFAAGLDRCGLYDVVEVGKNRLIGEVIRLEEDLATIQVYEENTGMKVGEEVLSEGHPLSAHLGPGLIGTIYDGIQRPLRELSELTGSFLTPGVRTHALDAARRWPFIPLERKGSTVSPGAVIGSVRETEQLNHMIMIPPDCERERIEWIAEVGDYTIDEPIARLESGAEIRMAQFWPVRKPRPSMARMQVSEPLVTGQRVVDVFFPISKGGTAAIPGGFGTGKTMTQHAVAKWCDADLIVYIGCGERGNEMTDVLKEFPEIVDPRTGRSLMERTILIANTSNMPVAAREVSIYTGVTLAEYYRDMGYHVAIMADSTSRWAEALRELSGRMEEMPAEAGFPAYLPTRLAEFYERAGRVRTLNGHTGSVTIIGAVSPPGGDFSEPVTQHTKRFIRCFWALDRDLANARHYPAISWIESYTEYDQEVGDWWDTVDPRWADARRDAMDLLKREQRLQQIVKLIGPDALPDNQRVVLLCADIIRNGFLQQSAFDPIDMYTVPLKQVMILRLILDFYRRAFAVIQAGAPLLKVNELSIVARLMRLKSEVPNDDLEGIREAEHQLDEQIGELERRYAG